MNKEELRQALYAASPFDLASTDDNSYRDAIDSVLDKSHKLDMGGQTYTSLIRLLAYCEAEERDDYEANPSVIHIYNDIKRLREYVGNF